MNFFQEFALLFAVAVPVLTVAGHNLVLAFLGEEGTLLLPSLAPYPAIITVSCEAPAATGEVSGEPANEPMHRAAA